MVMSVGGCCCGVGLVVVVVVVFAAFRVFAQLVQEVPWYVQFAARAGVGSETGEMVCLCLRERGGVGVGGGGGGGGGSWGGSNLLLLVWVASSGPSSFLRWNKFIRFSFRLGVSCSEWTRGGVVLDE